MTTDTQTPAAAATATGGGRVTLDEVRRVLADAGINPGQTNAGRVRVLLGNRGSQETIQKALIALRREQEQEQQQADLADLSDSAPAPPVPAELTGMLTGMLAAAWQSAHGITQAQMLRRIERTGGERDRAVAARATAEADLESSSRDIDESRAAAAAAQAEAQQAQQALAQAQQQQAAAAAAHAEALAQAQQAAAALEQQMQQERAAAASAAALAEAGRDLMRQELSRLTDQVGELKAHLYKRAEASAATAPASE